MFDYYPKLTVVGAGPGELDLITVKGVKALRSAGVVLYDHGVNETLLLEYAPMAVKVFVGKRRRQEALSQEDVNELVVEYAEKYGHVVRLKSHDSPDAAEIGYAQSRGLQVEYVPGVTNWLGAMPEIPPKEFTSSLTKAKLN